MRRAIAIDNVSVVGDKKENNVYLWSHVSFKDVHEAFLHVLNNVVQGAMRTQIVNFAGCLIWTQLGLAEADHKHPPITKARGAKRLGPQNMGCKIWNFS